MAVEYSIKDLEQITGVKAHTIRIWEKRYQIVRPNRTATNIRYYDNEDLKKILNISILNRNGFKISNIAQLSNEELGDKIVSISKNSSNPDNNIESLMVAMIELDETKFEKILNTLILNLGFEETVTSVLFPFFEKIGILWQIGSINPAQEHFITNLIRQKLIVAIDGLTLSPTIQERKTFLLYLHEHELHEIGLLFYSYLIRKKGHRVIYLGQMVPFKDLIQIIQIQNPQYVLTVISTATGNFDTQAHLNNLSSRLQGKRIFATGRQLSSGKLIIPANVTVINSFGMFKSELNNLA